jgi:hypothetical protein
VLEMGLYDGNVPGRCKSKHIKFKVFKGSSFPTSSMDEGVSNVSCLCAVDDAMRM